MPALTLNVNCRRFAASLKTYGDIMFVDRAKIKIVSGKGGNGCVSFRREPFVPEGGPNGGDGGKGGDVVFLADGNMRTLMDFKYKHKYEAENGQDGMKSNRFGKKGEDLVIKVPPGTLIIDEETGKLMKDLVNPGDSFIAAKGGKGGKGNVHFKNSVRQAPNFAEAGSPAKERNVILEMKLIADVGLVGFPNVGKSTLLSVCSSAKPKIANYHFTTIEPNLGVVQVGNTSFVMADIAGIIEGAHEGVGLGYMFLKHIERTRVLIHVVDVSGSEGRDPIDDMEKINAELEKYDPALLRKPQIVCANKIDLVDDDEKLKEFEEYVERKGMKLFKVSAPISIGTKELMEEAAKVLAHTEIEPLSDKYELFDFELDDDDPDYRKMEGYYDESEDVFVLEGKQLKKIFDSTNFEDAGSMRYLYKYIEEKGGIDILLDLGMEEGDTVRVEDLEFEYFED